MNEKIRNQARAIKAAQLCQEYGITQAEIAEAINASQSQVSRILNGKSISSTRLLEDVCLYVEQFGCGVTVEAVRNNEQLTSALASVWDGSSRHATALASVIRSLGALKVPVVKTKKEVG